MFKVAVVSSTSGSVLNAVLKEKYIDDRVSTIISDRNCGAIEVGQSNKKSIQQFITDDSRVFSDLLLEYFEANPHDLVISFYTKLFYGDLLKELEGKFLNFHPSILPACRGIDGFGDTLKSGSLFIGATVHFIDETIDTGYPIIQSAFPFNPELSTLENRHCVFVAQCRMFIQTVRWFEQERLRWENYDRPYLVGGKYAISEFSPNLDFDLAINYVPNQL